jgi:hypothetical protein
MKVEAIEMEIIHVCALLRADLQFGVDQAVQIIKGYASFNLRKQFESLAAGCLIYVQATVLFPQLMTLHQRLSRNILKTKEHRKGGNDIITVF